MNKNHYSPIRKKKIGKIADNPTIIITTLFNLPIQSIERENKTFRYYINQSINGIEYLYLEVYASKTYAFFVKKDNQIICQPPSSGEIVLELF